MIEKQFSSQENVVEHNNVSRNYTKFVLFVLIIIYILNYIDRNILSALAQTIKSDLKLSDTQLGFLAGGAFSVFYAVMGLPLARLADLWNRKNLVTIGLSSWSLMTTLSGVARAFLPLAVCRFGVGIGEASASPATYSLLYDYFPPKVRTTVLGLYSSGIYIGQGVGIFLGGAILSIWARAFPDPATAPFGLHGWQVAFFAVGLPGLLLAAVVFTLKEPVRGGLDGIPTPKHPAPLREGFSLLAAMIPPTSMILLSRRQDGGRALAVNAAAAALIATAAYGLTVVTGDAVQWAALGAGIYAVVSWLQTMAHRDPACLRMITTNRTLLCVIAATAAANFSINGVAFWAAPYYQRRFGLEPGTVGLMVGLASAVMGLIGVAVGGGVADRLRLRMRAGKVLVLFVCLVGLIPSAALFLFGSTVWVAYAGTLCFIFFAAAPAGPAVATMNDLVLPRMRATTSAFGFTIIYLVAGAIGPYFIGKLSDVFTASLGDSTQALRLGMAASLAVPAIGLFFAVGAIRMIGHDEPTLRERARALGEPV